MIINLKSRPEPEMIEVDLTGPQGNAFYILGLASKLSKRIAKESPEDPRSDNEKIQAEMMSGDYENLLEVFDGYFGDLVILYR
jgi:hypothetical protein